jgi:tyrosinase
MEEIEIIDFDGKTIKVVNPIMRYKFRPIDPSFDGDFANWEYSIRYPDANKKENIPGMIE